MNTQWIAVKVHPHAQRDVLLCLTPGRFEAWVRTKPIGGAANAAVARLLIRHLRVPASGLQLVKGSMGRQKLFRLSV